MTIYIKLQDDIGSSEHYALLKVEVLVIVIRCRRVRNMLYTGLVWQTVIIGSKDYSFMHSEPAVTEQRHAVVRVTT